MPVRKRGGIWQVEFQYRGQRVRRSAGPEASKQDALELETELRREIRQQLAGDSDPDRHYTFDDVLTKWLKSDAQRFKGLERLKSHVRNTLPFIRGVQLRHGVDAAEHMKETFLRDGLASSTINYRLYIIRRCLNLAFKWGWINQPLGKNVTNVSVHNERHVYLSYDEVDELAAACTNPEAGKAILLAAYTGVRKSELLSLGPKHIDSRGHIRLGTSKTGRPRIIPVPEFVEWILAELPLRITDGQLRGQWERARHKCDMDHVRFHDLRHTYAAWLITTGASMTAVRDLMGHADLKTTSRYIALETKHLEGAVAQLGAKKSVTSDYHTAWDDAAE